MIGTTLSQYEVTARLGAGGMGEVWRATDTRLGREVALKALPTDFADDPDRHARFEREAKVLASLNHPNIATLYGLEHVAADGGGGATADSSSPDAQTRPVHFLVMELVDGEGLDERIARGPVPVAEAATIALGIAEALEAAHESGIVHRDLKPANVKIRPDGSVKVLDFGLAKAWENQRDGQALSLSPTITQHATLEGVILGTASYMSPEQAAGTPADRRADIWAFGVVLWEMLTGRQLFDGETVSHVLASVLKDEPDITLLPDGTPPKIVDLVARCLRKKPRQRLQAIGDARIALEEYLADPSGAVAAVPGETGRPKPRRRLLFPAAIVLLSVGLGAALWFDRAAPPRVLRATIPPPPDWSFNLAPISPGPVAVSPDGTRLAFSAQGEDGNVHLFVRRLDSGQAVMLSGTDGAQYPFWSPDSRWVAFFTRRDGSLKKIDTTGGPPVTLCTAVNGKGGTWSRDGVIVFAADASEPISRVSSAGGEATAITTIDTERHNSHRHPRFLPDGTHFLYLARGRTEVASTVMVGSLDGGEPRELLLSTTQAEYAAGRLLFVRERTLMAQAFDPSSLELDGEAVPLAEDVLGLPGAAIAVFSASSTGVLAYQSGEAEVATTLEWRTRDGQPDGALGDAAPYQQAVLSPDGRHAAVTIPDIGTGMSDLWIYDVERNLRTRFTFDAADDINPVWSPEGSRLYFASNRGGGSYGIHAKDLDGAGEVEPVYGPDHDVFPSALSPDGEMLVVVAVPDGRRPDLWLVPLSGGADARSIRDTEFAEADGQVSPDGRWLVYTSDESGPFEVYVTSFPEPGRRWQVSTDSGVYPFWRSDGREIVYTAMDGTLMAAAVAGTADSPDIGEVTPLFRIQPPEPDNAFYGITADAARFLVVPASIQRADSLLNLIVDWPQFFEQRR